MSRQKISDTKIKAMKKMKELGFPIFQIATLLNVNRLTVIWNTDPKARARRLELTTVYQRRTKLVTGTCKDNIQVLKHLNKRPHPGICELCNKGDR